jgi:hypothetical protein
MKHVDQHKDRFVWITALLLVFVIPGSMLGCAPWEIRAEKNVVKNGIRFEAFRENDNGSKMGNLAEDTVIDGWPCRQGFVDFHADWRLDECHLSREYERNGIVMPEGTRVFPDKFGNPGICLFPRDVNIQGYLCRGNRSGGFMAAFYTNGKLHWFYTRRPVVVDGVTCSDSLFEAIYLHPDGGLRQCKLEKSIMVEGVRYQKGFVIHFDQAGAVIRN